MSDNATGIAITAYFAALVPTNGSLPAAFDPTRANRSVRSAIGVAERTNAAMAPALASAPGPCVPCCSTIKRTKSSGVATAYGSANTRSSALSTTARDRSLRRCGIARSSGITAHARGAGGESAGVGEADRAAQTGAAHAAVPARVLGEVLLVIVLRVVERVEREDLGGDVAVPRAAQHLLIHVA